MLYHFFQANMQQKLILILLACVLQFQFYHSRYVLIDVYDKDDGPKGAGCGEYCRSSVDCTGDSRCPYCLTAFGAHNCSWVKDPHAPLESILPNRIDRGTP